MGQNVLERSFQDIFRSPFTKLVGARNMANKIYQLDIQKWGAKLQAVHHAGTIHFYQDVVLQIELGVELQRFVHQIFLWTHVPLLDRF